MSDACSPSDAGTADAGAQDAGPYEALWDGTYSHFCARLRGGDVRCWGYNSEGQLGNGSRSFPMVGAVDAGYFTGATAMGLGQDHSCALYANGTLQCVGQNTSGQLGNGTGADSLSPVVPTLPGPVVEITAGTWHTCARNGAGAVYCFGHNLYGSTGSGTLDAGGTMPSRVLSPVNAGGLTQGVASLSSGHFHTCAVMIDGGVKCWGAVSPSSFPDPRPVDMTLDAGARLVASGDEHSCIITTAGKLKCWGRNQFGELGDRTTTPTNVPVDVAFLDAGVIGAVSSQASTCALLAGGRVECWGYNAYGTLGRSTAQVSDPEPGPVPLPAAAASIAGRGYQVCALLVDGRIRCWGAVIDLTDGGLRASPTPTEVPGL